VSHRTRRRAELARSERFLGETLEQPLGSATLDAARKVLSDD
jgi:hypothetical protein